MLHRYLSWTKNVLNKPLLSSIFFANCTSLPIYIQYIYICMYLGIILSLYISIYLSIYLSVHLFIYIICWCAAQKGWDLSKTKRPARTWPFTTNTIWYNRILQCPRSFWREDTSAVYCGCPPSVRRLLLKASLKIKLLQLIFFGFLKNSWESITQ